jgi:hypothetical protein
MPPPRAWEIIVIIIGTVSFANLSCLSIIIVPAIGRGEQQSRYLGTRQKLIDHFGRAKPARHRKWLGRKGKGVVLPLLALASCSLSRGGQYRLGRCCGRCGNVSASGALAKLRYFSTFCDTAFSPDAGRSCARADVPPISFSLRWREARASRAQALTRWLNSLRTSRASTRQLSREGDRIAVLGSHMR